MHSLAQSDAGNWSARVCASAILTQHASLLLRCDDDEDEATRALLALPITWASHAHLSVRIAALSALGALAVDLDGFVQRNAAAASFRAIFSAVQDASSNTAQQGAAPVAVAAAAALSSICELITCDLNFSAYFPAYFPSNSAHFSSP